MKFVKSVEVLIGVAATSGIALMLSGSAYAADAGTSTSSQTVVTTLSDAASVTTHQASTTIVADKHEAEPTASGSVSEKTGSPSSSHPIATDLSSVTASVNGNSSKPAVAVFGTSDKLSGDQPSRLEDAVPGVVSQTVPVTEAPVMRAQSADHVVFNSTVLPVQPKITNIRAVHVEDLASSVPTSPALSQIPDRDPAPTQPTGVFTRLTSVLAGSVIPQVFVSSVNVLAAALMPIVLLVAVILLIGVFVQSYGTWLRETGFLNAARSDASGAHLFSIFATPLVLSYAAPQGHIHSSFLMVSETKTVMVPNAYRKEETK